MCHQYHYHCANSSCTHIFYGLISTMSFEDYLGRHSAFIIELIQSPKIFNESGPGGHRVTIFSHTLIENVLSSFPRGCCCAAVITHKPSDELLRGGSFSLMWQESRGRGILFIRLYIRILSHVCHHPQPRKKTKLLSLYITQYWAETVKTVRYKVRDIRYWIWILQSLFHTGVFLSNSCFAFFVGLCLFLLYPKKGGWEKVKMFLSKCQVCRCAVKAKSLNIFTCLW